MAAEKMIERMLACHFPYREIWPPNGGPVSRSNLVSWPIPMLTCVATGRHAFDASAILNGHPSLRFR